MPSAGVFDDLIPVLIDDSVTSTVRQWHMLEAKKEESAEGTAEMTESQESESESESESEDGRTDDGDRTQNNDQTIRSQGQSKQELKKTRELIKYTY